MPLLTTDQAADRIGVSVRHVQRLIAGGDLVAIGPDRVDADSVAQWLALRQGSRMRAWEEPTAWAAVALLEDTPHRGSDRHNDHACGQPSPPRRRQSSLRAPATGLSSTGSTRTRGP